MIVKLLTEHHLEFPSLKGDCTGSSESTLVKMSHCWKSHALAQMILCMRTQLKVIRIRDNSGSEFHDRNYPIQSKLTRNYEFLARNFNKILCLVTFFYEIFLPSSQFQ